MEYNPQGEMRNAGYLAVDARREGEDDSRCEMPQRETGKRPRGGIWRCEVNCDNVHIGVSLAVVTDRGLVLDTATRLAIL